jgi:subtilisin family serine protease
MTTPLARCWDSRPVPRSQTQTAGRLLSWFEELERRLCLSGDCLAALSSLTTTASSAPVALVDDTPSSLGPSPSLVQSRQIINANAFSSNPSFAGIDGRGFSVAVLDTGIDVNHPFFGPDADGNGIDDRIVYQWDFADNDADATDVNGHGSNVSSIIGSQDATYKGIAPGVNIIALKVFSNSGSGSFASIEKALQWVNANAATYNIASVNMSLGDSGNYNTAQTLYGISDELAALAAKNVIVASAAGNSYFTYQTQGVSYPAADPNSLAVGAVWDGNNNGVSWSGGAIDYSSAADRVVSFSQRSTSQVDVFAPGAFITGANATGGTVSYAGTSQATPHVAAAAALAQQLAMRDLGRRLTFVEFTNLLRTTGTSIIDGDDENDNVTNTGATFKRLDLLSLAAAIEQMAVDASPQSVAAQAVEGQSVSLSLPSTNSNWSYLWDLDGDGVYGETGAAATRGNETGTSTTFSAAGLDGPSSWNVSVKTQAYGAARTDTGAVQIINAAPSLSLSSANTTIIKGQSFTLNLGATDPGVDTISSWTIDWGDGNIEVFPGNSSSVTHNYATVASFSVTGSATDEDGTWSAPTGVSVDVQPTVSIADINAAEGDSGTTPFTLTLSLSDASTSSVTVLLNTADGSATTADNDYQALTNLLVTFAPGQTTATVNVLVNGDQTLELDESFSVWLSAPTNAGLGDSAAIVTVVNDDTVASPSIASLSTATGKLNQGSTITLTASGVLAPAGRTLARVEFYRDTNANGLIDVGIDTLLGSDTSSASGWTLTPSSTTWSLGNNTLMARAVDSTGAVSNGVTTVVNVNGLPTIGSLTGLPSPVQPGSALTITAANATDPDGTVTAVEIYFDSNNNGKIDPATDTKLTVTLNGLGQYVALVTAPATGGSYKYLARALDNSGAFGATKTLTAVVTSPPRIGTLTATPNPVSRGQTLTITATDVVDDDGTVASVAFYRDTDGDGLVTSADKVLGNDTTASNGWSVSTSSSSSNLVVGVNRILAVAKDNKGMTGAPKLTLVTIDAPPTLSSFTASSTPKASAPITLTVKASTDTTSVTLYRDNGDGVFSAATEISLGDATYDSLTNSWKITLPASTLPSGSVRLWARAFDGVGYSAARSLLLTIGV